MPFGLLAGNARPSHLFTERLDTLTVALVQRSQASQHNRSIDRSSSTLFLRSHQQMSDPAIPPSAPVTHARCESSAVSPTPLSPSASDLTASSSSSASGTRTSSPSSSDAPPPPKLRRSSFSYEKVVRQLSASSSSSSSSASLCDVALSDGSDAGLTLTSSTSPTPSSTLPLAVIVVDPVSTGANVADALLRRGVAVIAVTSGPAPVDLPVDAALRTDYAVSLTWDETSPSALLSTLLSLPYRIQSVLIGSELGIACGDSLSSQLGLPSNGVEGSEARRDKWSMQEKVRKAGLRAPKQACAREWSEVVEFLQQQQSDGSSSTTLGMDEILAHPIVLKPLRSAGSDQIFKVHTVSQASAAFAAIMGRENVFGCKNDAVLVQEFLEGKEYIVDTVSKDGVHKVVALWEYDKRSIIVQEKHESKVHDFVYYGQASMSGTTPLARSLVDYTLLVLSALDIRHGAAHCELILAPHGGGGPCLVEVGARPQGCEGTFIPVAKRCWGCDQVGALVSSAIAPEEFDALPMICGEELEAGFKVDFVAQTEGKLKRIDHLEEIAQLESFLRFDLLPALGSRMRVTVDCFTSCGSVSLVHRERAALMKDVERVREMEKTMWIVEEEEEQHA
jgi:hypothetical protein